MTIMHIMGAAALLATLGTATARAAEPMQPTGKWNVDFGEAHCVAMRGYGPPDAPITLAFKPAPIGDVMQLSVIHATGKSKTNQYHGSLKVDGAAPVPVSLLGYPAPDGKLRVTAVNLTPAAYAPIRTATTIRLRSADEVDGFFALSQMKAVAQTLDRCMLDLRKQWNIGEHGATLKQAATELKPKTNLFSFTDYPEIALRSEGQGLVQAMLLIDEAGRVASCMVTETSGHASLDAQTCIVLSLRARFTPAVGADGKPAKSGSSARIKWKL